MMRTINTTHIEGLIYDHKLVLRQVSNKESKNYGGDYISGTLNVATDDACMNVIQVHYSYVTPTTAKGGTNNTFNVLKRIIDGVPCVAKDGKENATKVAIDSSIALNEFFSDLSDATPVSVKRNEGGFIHFVNELNEDAGKRDTFKVDMVVCGTRDVEANPERGLPEKVVVSGYIFDFRGAVMPVDFDVRLDAGMKFFRRLDCSGGNPVFLKAWGHQVSQTIRNQIVEESAFGENSVRISESTTRSFEITGVHPEFYAWNDESTLTEMELKKALQDREIYLASMKKRQEDYQNSRPTRSTASTSADYIF